MFSLYNYTELKKVISKQDHILASRFDKDVYILCDHLAIKTHITYYKELCGIIPRLQMLEDGDKIASYNIKEICTPDGTTRDFYNMFEVNEYKDAFDTNVIYKDTNRKKAVSYHLYKSGDDFVILNDDYAKLSNTFNCGCGYKLINKTSPLMMYDECTTVIVCGVFADGIIDKIKSLF